MEYHCLCTSSVLCASFVNLLRFIINLCLDPGSACIQKACRKIVTPLKCVCKVKKRKSFHYLLYIPEHVPSHKVEPDKVYWKRLVEPTLDLEHGCIHRNYGLQKVIDTLSSTAIWLNRCQGFIALKPPVWSTLNGLYCIGGPSEFSSVCWDAVGCEWGATSVYFGITYVWFVPCRLPVIAVESQYQYQIVLFLSKVSFKGHTQNFQNNACRFETWMGFVGQILIKLGTFSIWGCP